MVGRDYGLPVGSTVPDFVLQDQDSAAHRLKSLLGPKGGVLLFVRSADWCPYCKSQLADLEQNREDFAKLGLGIAAVSYESVAVLRNFARQRGIRFPLLSDPGAKVIREMGVLNDVVPKDDPYFGSPYPCMFVLDGNAVIVAKYFEGDPRLTRAFPNILAHQYGVIPASRQSEAESKQLKFVATTSHSLVTAGQRVSVTLNVELKPNMHVYAPGVPGYIPIEWKIKESGATSASDVRYPRSEQIHLEAIQETVPVYRGRFQLRGVITLAEDSELRHQIDNLGNFVVVAGLRYQACDDHTCYLPQNLPMKWSFHYVGFDERGSAVPPKR
jgi:peroxiredoxin